MSKTIWRAVSAEEARVRQTVLMQRKLLDLYEGLHSEIKKALSGKEISQDLSRVQLKMLELDIESYIKEINKDLENDIRESMDSICVNMVEDKRKLLKEYGFSADYIRDSYIYVPKTVVNNILSGTVYQEGWSLSNAIWGHTKEFNKKLTHIIAKGTATGKSAFEVAMDLEKYVNLKEAKPSRKIEFINPHTGEKDYFYFGNVDYNAQRLARTMISHAYQQAFMHVNGNDPFVTKYVWMSAMQHGRTCKVCMERNGKLFDKDKLPLDHPNGLCTFEAYIPDGIDGVRERLGKWIDAPVGTYPEIDRYADSLLKKYEGKGLNGY